MGRQNIVNEDYTMTKEEIIELMKMCPFKAVTHLYFEEDQYIYWDGYVIRNEKDSIFEDFCTEKYNGMRCRTASAWNTGWMFNSMIKVEGGSDYCLTHNVSI